MARPTKLTVDPEALPDNDIAPADEVFLSAKEIKKRYSNPSDMTLARWQDDPKTLFPKPVKVGRHNFWPLSKIIAFERERIARAERVAA